MITLQLKHRFDCIQISKYKEGNVKPEKACSDICLALRIKSHKIKERKWIMFSLSSEVT